VRKPPVEQRSTRREEDKIIDFSDRDSEDRLEIVLG
jgi:hypothetical protein